MPWQRHDDDVTPALVFKPLHPTKKKEKEGKKEKKERVSVVVALSNANANAAQVRSERFYYPPICNRKTTLNQKLET